MRGSDPMCEVVSGDHTPRTSCMDRLAHAASDPAVLARVGAGARALLAADVGHIQTYGLSVLPYPGSSLRLADRDGTGRDSEDVVMSATDELLSGRLDQEAR